MNAVRCAAGMLSIAILATGQAPSPKPDTRVSDPRVEELLKTARAFMEVNRLNDSIASLEQAARLQPDHAEVFNVLGTVYTLGGSTQEAEKAFARAVQLSPDNWEYRYAHGRVLFELRLFDGALREQVQAVQLNRASAKAWTALGQAQERADQDQQAERSYRNALAVCAGTDCSWPLLQLGYRHSRDNNLPDALPYFQKAVQARPQWSLPHFHLGKTLAAMNELDSARAELETAIGIDNAKPDYHYQLAQIYRRLRATEKAEAEFARFRSLKQQEQK